MIINVTVKRGLVRLVLTKNGSQVLESDYGWGKWKCVKSLKPLI